MERRDSFATLLRRHRLAAGLTQDALAERARLSARTVSDLERGVSLRPRLDSLILLSDSLALTPTDRSQFEEAARHVVPAHDTPAQQPPPPRTNLPRALSSFIARPRDQAAVTQLLATVPLVTLTGVGGCGKTRLALEVAADVLAHYPDGVWLVALAPVADPTLVPQAIAAALEVVEEPGHPLLATLTAFLQSRRMLLVLDNCEHLVTACATVTSTLLQACPSLQILATSREALGITGERAMQVPSLSLPDPYRAMTVEHLAQSEAVRLFMERAQAVRPTFTLSEQNAALLGQVCRRLDGIPLALELAAARLSALTLEDLTARLDDRFRLLTGGSRTALPRQQTLRATLDWSWDLLSGGERVLLRRLAVFAGGWTLEAAEAVCGGDGIDTAAVLDLLTGLVHQSLVVLDEREGRYRFLETVRQYAQEHLVARGEAVAVRERHLHWCLALGSEARSAARNPAQGRWLDWLERELENLRVALSWARDSGQGTIGLRLAEVLGPFWYQHSHQREGLHWLETFLELPRVEHWRGQDQDQANADAWTSLRAWALHLAGTLAQMQTEPRVARALLDQSLSLFRQVGDRKGIAAALDMQGGVARDEGCFVRAGTLLEESVRLASDLASLDRAGTARYNLALTVLQQGNQARAGAMLQEYRTRTGGPRSDWAAAHVLFLAGQIAWAEGDLAHAQLLGEQSLTLLQQVGDRRGIALVLAFLLGPVARERGDVAQAVALCEESLVLGRELGDIGVIGWASQGLGLAACEQGDLVRAETALAHGLTVFWTRGMQWFAARCLAGLAGVASEQGQAAHAARLAGATEALLATMGAPLPRGERAPYARALAAARAQLGEETYAAAWAEGQGMPLEAIIAAVRSG